ncbi:beta-ketoacyl-ACP synthase II [Clostridiaceae bacterium HSG29]|nr:beta-ketoacyl-ACP synthase II [Clostridiaceae bacterium HSG29]
MQRRVVVTGMGVISPIGNSIDEFWNSLKEGKSGISMIENFDTSEYTTKIAGEVKEFDYSKYLDRKEVKRMDRFTQFAVVAAGEALEDSKLDVNNIDMNKFGTILGCGIGGIQTLEDQHKRLLEKGPKKVSPFLIPMMIINMVSGQVSMKFGAKGPNTTVVTACASATNAIGDAYNVIKRGDADFMFAGGSEAAITPIGVSGFSVMKALSTRNDDPTAASRPFDKDRDGFVMAEGAGILVLEEYEHAVKRNANIYGEVVGFGYSADAHHITAPAPEGEGGTRSMRMAVENSNIKPTDVDYINAHGTSTPMNDKFETMAIKNLFKDHAYKLVVNSTKSMTGHLLGASGGVEAIATLLSMKNSYVHRTLNYATPDEGIDLDYAKEGKNMEIKYALSNSLGFGGHNATLAFKKYE